MNTPALEYIPHSGTLALINEITETGEGWIECSVKPQDAWLFRTQENKIPSWIGIEYMAQTIAAFAGWNDSQRGLPVKVGFLLGSRKVALHTDFFENDIIYTRAELVFKDDELGSFKCSISSEDRTTLLAEATVNVFQPRNIDQFIKEVKTK